MRRLKTAVLPLSLFFFSFLSVCSGRSFRIPTSHARALNCIPRSENDNGGVEIDEARVRSLRAGQGVHVYSPIEGCVETADNEAMSSDPRAFFTEVVKEKKPKVRRDENTQPFSSLSLSVSLTHITHTYIHIHTQSL
jgi:hypothetical protein